MKGLPPLKDLREQQALSLRELAKMSGVSHVAISQIERGERQARPSTLRKLADALRVEPAVLSSKNRQDLWSPPVEPSPEQTNSSSVSKKIQIYRLKDGSLRERLIETQRLKDGSLRERCVADREASLEYRTMPSSATMNGDLAIARAKLNSDIAGELEESAQLALHAIQELVASMTEGLERELREYEALPNYYFEDPSAARRIGEFGASMASSQLQDLKMLRKFIDVRDQALQKLSTDGPVRTQRNYPDAMPKINISERQQKVLITVLESGEVEPSTVAERLEISVSTAYRDLSVLEEHGLVSSTESGKRMIRPFGRDVALGIADKGVERRSPTNEAAQEVRNQEE
jgi:transcriptional regulator with XRE-family HTH domain